MVRILHALSGELSSGTIKQVRLLAQSLATLGYESCVCSLQSNTPRSIQMASVEIRLSICHQSSVLDPTFVYRFGGHLRRVNPDIVHWWGDPTNWTVMFANRMHGNRAFVVSVPEAGQSGLISCNAIERWLTSNAPVVLHHEHTRTTMQRRGLAANRLTVVPAGVAFGNDQQTMRSLHVELELPPEVRFVAAMGDLLQKMRFKDLIWALDLLRVVHPEMHLVIIGEGPDEQRLRDFAAKVGPEVVVHFLGYDENPNDLLTQCVCLWHSSPTGCCSAILEAMAAGVPVVAADMPQYHGIVQPGETGFLVSVGDSAEFARKTNILLGDTELAQRLGQTGLQTAKQCFSTRSMADGISAVYDRVLADRRAAA